MRMSCVRSFHRPLYTEVYCHSNFLSCILTVFLACWLPLPKQYYDSHHHAKTKPHSAPLFRVSVGTFVWPLGERQTVGAASCGALLLFRCTSSTGVPRSALIDDARMASSHHHCIRPLRRQQDAVGVGTVAQMSWKDVVCWGRTCSILHYSMQSPLRDAWVGEKRGRACLFAICC